MRAAAMACALSLLAPTAAIEAADVELSLEAVKSEVLVAEPLLAVATLKAARPVLLGFGSPLVLLVDGGTGFVRFERPRFSSSWDEWPEPRLPPPEGFLTEFFLSYNAVTGNWVFPSPGRYRLMVEHHEANRPIVRSPIVTVDVKAPTGDEAAVLSEIAKLDPDRKILAFGEGTVPPLLAIARRYPASVYIQHARVMALHDRIRGFWTGQDPDGRDAPPDSDRKALAAFARPRVAGLRGDIEDLVETAGQFEPEALDLLSSAQEAAGDSEAARATYEKIVRDFPNRYVTASAREALEEEDEE